MTTLWPIRLWPLWDVFFPPLCRACGQSTTPQDILFCMRCWADAPLADLRDLRALRHVDMVRAVFHYGEQNMIRAVVHALKYEGMRALAAVMCRHLLTRMPDRYAGPDVVWCAVPLHWRRVYVRGFNQSRLLADGLCRITGHAPPQKLLRRIRHTPSQTARTVRMRSANVRGAFAVPHYVKPPKAVLLVDDVITTGATMDECARTLKAAGVEWVGAFAFALARHDASVPAPPSLTSPW